MNIGKLSFSEIIRLGFERNSARVISGWIFITMVVIAVLQIISSTLVGSGSWQTTAAGIVSGVNVLVSLGLCIAINLGAFVLAKANIAKTKKVDVPAQVKALFWKALGATLVICVSVAVLALAAFGLGFLVKVPYIGEPLMALLFFPAIVVFGMIAIYFLVGTKIIFAVLVDKPKTSVLTAVQKIWTITVKSPEKLFFNFVLSILPILFTALTFFVLVGILAVVPYLAFGWALPLYDTLRQFAPQLGVLGTATVSWPWAINYIFSNASVLTQAIVGLGFCAIAAYALSYIINVAAVAYYSIYLDAQ